MHRTKIKIRIQALRSWLHDAGLRDHGLAQPAAPLVATTDFEVATDWLVAVGQLVLRTEWALTSVGRACVTEKLWKTWHGLTAFDADHLSELARVVPQALATCEREAQQTTCLLG